MNKLQPRYILIIDDSPDQQTLLKILLESRGYTTRCASNGQEALEVLHSSHQTPQTILLDLNMPLMGGLEFRQRQQRDPKLADIPVIIMSGEEHIEKTRLTAQCDVLGKPLSIAVLMDALEKKNQQNALVQL